jgi:hypothetical protein
MDEKGCIESKLKAAEMHRTLCGVKQRIQAAIEFANVVVRSCKLRSNCVFCLIETMNVIAATAALPARGAGTGNQGKIVSPWLY